GPHLQDRPLELVEQERRELLLRLLERAVVAVRVADVPHLGNERLERLAPRFDARDWEGARPPFGGRGVSGEGPGLWGPGPDRPPAGRSSLPARRPAPATHPRAPRSTAARASRPTRRPLTRPSRRRRGSGLPAQEKRPPPPARSRADARTSSWCRTAA